MIFDIDLDETLPAPWEWDIKRLAASFVLACRHNGFSEEQARDSVLRCVRAYQDRMAQYSDMTVLEVWYASIDVEELIHEIHDDEARERMKIRLKHTRAERFGARVSRTCHHRWPDPLDQGKPAADLPSARTGTRNKSNS